MMKVVLVVIALFAAASCTPHWEYEPTFYSGDNAPLPKEGANLDNLGGNLWYQNGYVPCVSLPARPDDTNVYEHTIHTFDLSNNVWTAFAIPDQAKPDRAFAGQWTHEPTNTVYTYGGVKILCGQNPVFPLYQDLWRYNVSSNTWTDLTATMVGSPGCRVGGAFARVGDDDVYLHGGLNCFFGAENDLWKYHIPTNTWTLIQSSLHNDTVRPHGRFASQMVWSESKNCLLIANGDTLEGVPLADVWKLDLSTLQWTKLVNAADSIIGDNVQFCAFTRGRFLFQVFGDRDESFRWLFSLFAFFHSLKKKVHQPVWIRRCAIRKELPHRFYSRL
jgi:galactose oxidase-like protein